MEMKCGTTHYTGCACHEAKHREEMERLQAACTRYREALEWIAGGCLVPPDGGSPRLDDAIDVAAEALSDTSAGTEFLDRMHGLERVVEAARKFTQGPHRHWDDTVECFSALDREVKALDRNGSDGS